MNRGVYIYTIYTCIYINIHVYIAIYIYTQIQKKNPLSQHTFSLKVVYEVLNYLKAFT